jgi:hypothetical protein
MLTWVSCNKVQLRASLVIREENHNQRNPTRNGDHRAGGFRIFPKDSYRPATWLLTTALNDAKSRTGVL